MTRTIYRERIPSSDPRLRRHVHHDSESRRYPYPTAGLKLVSAVHERHIPILDQGNLGSCTGNAGIGCMGTTPLYEPISAEAPLSQVPGPLIWYGLDEPGAVQLYSDATKIDDAPGEYPPDDTGSDGLSVAKVLKSAGEISGYQHTFTLQDALLALTQTPIMIGINWYEQMFTPDADGRVRLSGALAGGHELCSREIDVERERVVLDNSWGGPNWGVQGRCWLTFADFGALLSRQGDVTILLPLSQPAPVPTPDGHDPADVALAAVARPWVARVHTSIAGNRAMQAAAKAWLAAKGL